MDQANWRQLAEERVRDSEILLVGTRWAAAYYLAGYAVECGFNSCVLAYVEKEPDIVFRDRKYSESCWTHNIGTLVRLAGLDVVRDADTAANTALGVNWGLSRAGTKGMRYQFKAEPEARRLYQAVTEAANGVLPWIRNHW